MYKIIIDSCGELTDSLKKDEHFCNVALELDVDGYRIRDDESFDQHDFLRRVRESVKGPKSSCPSPEEYIQFPLSIYRRDTNRHEGTGV